MCVCTPFFGLKVRLFCAGGNIYSQDRNRLQAQTGQMLMFLHYNVRVLDVDSQLVVSWSHNT